MSWLFSQALVADCTQVPCSGTDACALWRSTLTPSAYYSHGSQMEFFPSFRFGMTFVPLTDTDGEAVLISFQAGFPVRMSASPVQEPACPTEHAAVSGESTPESSGKFSLNGCSRKTPPCSPAADSILSSAIFPDSGMMLHGQFYPLPSSELRTCAKGCGCSRGDKMPFLTPTATDGRRSLLPARTLWTHWQEHPNSNLEEQIAVQAVELYGMGASGYLNPEWVEWLMGWPTGSTALNALETDRFHAWQRLHLSVCKKNY